MEFGVLGPLRVIDHEEELTPSATKQRQMLALLLLTHGHVVPVDMFIEELWDGNPTPTALASVHTYTMQLRRMFCNPPRHERAELAAGVWTDGQSKPRGRGGHGAASSAGRRTPSETRQARTVGAVGQRLVTLDRAYRLDVRPHELDIDAFNERVNIGRTRLARKEYEAAAEQLGEALELWQRGPALPDVVAGPVLYPAVRALEVTRLEVVGQRIWAELHLGRHYELVSELAALHCQHPTNEMFATQFMLALHRSGRRAEALEAFHRHRAALREELGLTPPPQLHELYTDILRNHPRLDVSTLAPMAERGRDVLDMAS